MRDTSPDVAQRQREWLRNRTPAQRAETFARLCASARELMRAGIRMRHPGYSVEDVELALLRLVLADDALFSAAKPGAPLLAP
jgi:hypothetical protein